MSEFLSMATHLKTTPERVNTIVQIVIDFFDGVDPEKLREQLKKELGGISSSEFAYAAQLFADGKAGATDLEFTEKHELMIHDIFDEALGSSTLAKMPVGHPVHSFLLENVEINKLVNEMRLQLQSSFDIEWWQKAYKRLWQVDIHYVRKENQLFPFLEKKGFDRPSTVMWSVHDDIRAAIKNSRKLLDTNAIAEFLLEQNAVLDIVADMTFKEEKILLPTSLDLLADKDWDMIRYGEEEIGYCLIPVPVNWSASADPTPKNTSKEEDVKPIRDKPKAKRFVPPSKKRATNIGGVSLAGGFLSPEQINLLFKKLPLDITLVDEHDQVKFYNRGDERVFPRSPGIINREVRYCHPPKSVHIVLEIVDAFKAGERDTAEFWLQMANNFLHIRYFALRDAEGNYKGVLEVSQDVTHVRSLENKSS